ncbi:DnaJ domain protein [Actinidia chinensis var. chinensis]|uniref:DnaJ domain protein n=1 Tax=Actinidia chinensis var. chinensis TaxID=1590841 RepID=A0A2R6S312_ACTCC|nr:DnaJ domain protein [Actinidia chinensis var. chinensis]
MDGNGRGGRPRPRAELLLKASEYFLRHRYFDRCRKYALQAQDSDPTTTGAAEILAVADVLAASQNHFYNKKPDHYAIIGVNRYSDDSQLIRNRFKSLFPLLNPNANKFAFADEAFGLVREAWTVLSNPLKKSQFDNELRIFDSEGKNERFRPDDDETFWTMCPYCYYVYEYSRVYKDCCLRCQNQSCGRAFHAAEITAPPPPEVVRRGQYWCLGFNPIRFEGGEGRGFSSWSPFVPMKMKSSVSEGGNGSNGGNLVEISDESDDEIVGKSNETPVDVSCEKLKTEEDKNVCAKSTDQTEVPCVPKPVMKRKKSVPMNSRKIMGKGIRIRKDETIPGHGEGLDLDSGGEEDFGYGIAGEMEIGIEGYSGVGFVKGEDDVYLVLQDGF